MIGKLTGLVDTLDNDFILLDVGGVGYRVFCSAKTMMKLPPKGHSAALFIETQVREDHIHLFGFADQAEKDAFTLLTTVQGVGAKVALAILSALSANDIQMAVMTGDGKAFTQASGVGPKLGVRIVTELKGKIKSFGGADLPPMPTVSDTAHLDAAISALVNLGYGRSEAGMVVAGVLRTNPDATLNDLIRLSLKEIGKNNG